MSPAQPSLVPEKKEPIKMAKKSPLSPEARSIINARVSRRAVLAGIGGVGAAGALAACGSSGDSAAGGDLVRWGNWPLYLDFDEDGSRATVTITTKRFKVPFYVVEDYTEDQQWEFSISDGWKFVSATPTPKDSERAAL